MPQIVNLTYNDFRTYFETLATEHVDLKRFFSITSFEEIFSELERDIEPPMLALEPTTWRPTDNDGDNIRKILQGGLMVLDIVQEQNDFAREQAVMDSTEIIMNDLLSRIRNDEREEGNLSRIPKVFDLDSVRLQEAHNMFDNYHGWRMSFELNQPLNLRYDASKFSG